LKGGSTKIVSKQVYDFIKIIVQIGQDYYPEILSRIYIVNAPLLFSGIWAIVKPWIDERTKAKITTLGAQFESQLLEQVSEVNLPDFLGGKCSIEECGEFMNNEQGLWLAPDENDGRDKDEDSFGRNEEDKDNTDDFSNLKNMLAGMNIIGKSLKPQPKKDEDEDVDGFNPQNFKNLIPDTPINTQMGEDDV